MMRGRGISAMEGRKKAVAALSIVWLVLAAPGCSAQPQLAAAPVATDLEPWAVRLTVLGGIRGLAQTIQVDNLGQISVEDLRTGAQSEPTQLSREQLQQLRDLSSAVKADVAVRPANSECADCLGYELVIVKGQEKPVVLRWDSLASPDPDASELATRLQTLGSSLSSE